MARIAICYFGITRSLPYTIGSIRKNVWQPASRLGHVSTFCHFFDQGSAIAVSGKIEGQNNVKDAELLSPDRIEIEDPGGCLSLWNFEAISEFGDSWGNGFISLRNLIHQLHSLSCVTQLALDDNPDIVVFCRPDLKYHDSLAPVLDQALKIPSGQDVVFLPSWQNWGGYNDRFAIAVGSEAITAYGMRIRKALDYCGQMESALNSEKLLKFCLTEADVDVVKIPSRASRVRASGARVWESFGDDAHAIRREQFKKRLWILLDRSGLKPIVRKIAFAMLRRR